jgi:vancomycin permeability regulator SanA
LTYDDAGAVPQRPVAIVFGAGLADGKPSAELADRVHGAVQLYLAGRVSHLLTGDHSVDAYDEPSAMKDQAIAEGVPAAAITRDYAGFSTYDSCYRARDVFGVHAAVVVTQDYHLSRALYTCRALGIDAVGLIIPDWQHEPEKLNWQYERGMAGSYMSREWLARTKEVVAANLTHPAPTFLGPYEGLRET